MNLYVWTLYGSWDGEILLAVAETVQQAKVLIRSAAKDQGKNLVEDIEKSFITDPDVYDIPCGKIFI